jgi:Uma2 family endonuclease
MNEPYQEMVAGEVMLRPAPNERHEQICARLHEALMPLLADQSRFRLVAPREKVQLQPNTALRPDLAIVQAESGRIWLCAEVIDSQDHLSDTVHKKAIYEDIRLPRLWMVDPRYDNVEVYHASAYGIVLKEILARKQTLTERELPALNLPLQELFGEG